MQQPSMRGFTLLEVMIALVIFAWVSVFCYRQIDIDFKTSARIEQKYLALWMAESTLDEIFVNRQISVTGESRTEVPVLSNRWVVISRISEGSVKKLKKIEVSVYPDDKNVDAPVLTLTRYMSED
jgi:general secretion pathway protein I